MGRELEGRVALVTGATSGIGRATVLRFASEGARVALVGRDARSLSETAGEVAGRGGEALGVKADVTAEEDARRAVAETVEKAQPDKYVSRMTKALRANKENRTRFETMKVDLEARNLAQRSEADQSASANGEAKTEANGQTPSDLDALKRQMADMQAKLDALARK